MRLGHWISLVALLISLYILWQIRQIVLLVFAAVVMATILNRLVRRLQEWHVKRGFAIATTILLLLIIVLGFFGIVVPRLIGQFEQVGKLLPQAVGQLENVYAWLQTHVPGQVLDYNWNPGDILQSFQSVFGDFIGNFFFLVRNSIATILSLLLFLALTILLMVNPSQYRQVFVHTFPAFYRPRINDILDECEHSLVGWFRGTLFAMAVIGILSYIALLSLRVPLPLVNAMLAGVLEFVPNVGPTLSVIPPALLGLADAPWKGGGVILAYIAIQQFESLVLVPFLMRQEVSLLPVFTILSVVIFAFFFGFLGLFLAVPLLIVVQIALKQILIEDIMNPWQEPHHRPHRSRVWVRAASKDS